MDIKNKEGKTAMQIAYEEGEYECGNYLKTVEGMLLFILPFIVSCIVPSFDIASLDFFNLTYAKNVTTVDFLMVRIDF